MDQQFLTQFLAVALVAAIGLSFTVGLFVLGRELLADLRSRGSSQSIVPASSPRIRLPRSSPRPQGEAMRVTPSHYCQKDHAIRADEVEVLDELPKSQGGCWRHGCVECAFEAGLKLGAQREREALLALLEKRRKL